MTSCNTILGSELILFKSNCESLMLSMMNRVKWSKEGSKMLFRTHSLYYGSDRCNCSYSWHFKPVNLGFDQSILLRFYNENHNNLLSR